MARRNNNEPACWEGIVKGDKLNTVKKFLKKKAAESKEALPTFQEDDLTLEEQSELSMEEQVELFITRRRVVPTVFERSVNLANPDGFESKPFTVKQRAKHLITREKEKNNHKVRVPDKTREPFVPAIPRTLSDADLVATGKYYGNDRIYYFRNYKNGTHLVITDTKGNIVEQGKADDLEDYNDGLETQYPPNLNDAFDKSFTIQYKKGGFYSEPTCSETSPYPAYSDKSPHSEAATPSVSTVALSNPAGVTSDAIQTGGFP